MATNNSQGNASLEARLQANSGTTVDRANEAASGSMPYQAQGINFSETPTGYNLDSKATSRKIGSGKDYIPYTNYFGNLYTRDAAAARSQSAGEQLALGLYQGIVGEVIGGTMQGLGSFAMGPLSEQNFLYTLGSKLQETTQEAGRLFEKDPGKAFAFNDVAWWAKNTGSILSTLSMLIPGAAVGRLATLAGRAAMTAGRAGRIAQRVEAAAKIDSTLDKAKAASAFAGKEATRAAAVEARTNQIATAIGMRHAENIRESVDVAEQAKQDFLDSGVSLEDMKGTEAYRAYYAENGRVPQNLYELSDYVGGAAAKRTYAVNSANIVFDLYQTSLIFKPFKVRTRGVKATTAEAAEAAKKLGKGVVKESKGTRLSRFWDRYGEYPAGMASEGAEEAVNFIGSGEGAAYAEQLRDDKHTSTFSERLNTYLNDDHLWESAFFGALGGGFFQALGGIYGKKQNALLHSYQDRIRTQEYFAEEIKKAEEAGDAKRVAELKSGMITNLAMQAAQQGRVDALLDMINDDSYIEELAKNGLGSVEELMSKRQDIIDTILAAEKHYIEAATWAHENGMDAFAKGEYLKDSITQQNHLDFLNKRAAELEEGGLVQEDPEAVLAAKKQLMLDIETETNGKPENTEFGELHKQLSEEIAKEEEKRERPINVKAANEATQEAVAIQAMRDITKNRLANMKSDASIVRYKQKGEEVAKAQAKKLEQDSIAEINKTTDIAKLEDLLKKGKRNKATKSPIHKAVEKRLEELRKQQELENSLENGEADTTTDENTGEDETVKTADETSEDPDAPQDPNVPQEPEPPGPDGSEDETFGPSRRALEIEPVDALVERIQTEGPEARDKSLAAYIALKKQLQTEKKKYKDASRKAKKKGERTDIHDANADQVALEIEQINEIIKALKKLQFDLNLFNQDPGTPKDPTQPTPWSDHLTPEQVVKMQAELAAKLGSPVFLLDLINGFLPNLIKGSDLFGLGMNEWRLRADGPNVKDGSLILTDAEKDQLLALQALLDGKASLRIVETEEEYGDTSEEETIFSKTEAQNVTRVPRRPVSRSKEYVARRDSKERHYAIEVDFGNRQVLIGYVPQVTTLAKHAKNAQDMTLSPETRANWMAALEESGTPMQFKVMYAMMHAHGYNAIQALDQLMALRQMLDNQNGRPVTVKLHPNSTSKGSLLRPPTGSTRTVIELDHAESSIEKHGIAILMRDDTGKVFLYNLKDKARMSKLPYQDGRVEGDPDGRDYGFGSFYIPIPATSDPNGEIIYVRVGDVSISKLGEEIKNDVLDALDIEDAKERAAELRQYMPAKHLTNEPGLFGLKGAMQSIKNGAITTPSMTYFIKNGEVVGSYNAARGVKIHNKAYDSTLTIDQLIGMMPFRASVEKVATDYTLDNEAVSKFVANVPAPVAPIIDSNGNFLGYRHPISSLEQDNAKKIFPDTRQTEVSLQIDTRSLPEPIDVVEPDQKPPSEPKGKSEPAKPSGVRKTSGRNPFLTTERAAESQYDRPSTAAEQAEAENWLEQNLPHVPFRRVKGLIVEGGVTAYGIWQDGMIKVSSLGVVGAEYHEAFHAVMDTYLSPRRRERILAEAKKKYGDLGPIELEEKLAEKFREYMLTDGKSMTEKSATRRFFSEILELIKAMFTGEFQARRLMQQINKGKFAYKPDARTQEYVTKFMAVPGFTAVELKELSRVLPLALNETLEHVSTHLSYAITDKAKAQEYLDELYADPAQAELKEKILNISNAILDRRAEQQDEDSDSTYVGNKELARLVLEAAFADEGGIETLFYYASLDASEDVKEKMDADIDRIRLNRDGIINDMMNRNHIVDALIGALEIDVITGTTDAQQYNNKMSLQEVNPKEKIPASVRNLISRTVAMPTVLSESLIQAMEQNDPEILKQAVLEHSRNNTYNQFSQFGLPMMLDFNAVYPYLLHHLSQATTYQEMINIMQELGTNGNPDMLLLIAKLEDERTSDLIRNQFFVAFKKARTNEINVTLKVTLEEDQRTEKVTVDKRLKGPMSPQDQLGLHNRQVMLTMLGGMSTSEQDALIDDLSNWVTQDAEVSFEQRKELLNLLQKAGFTTRTPGALSVAIMRLTPDKLGALALGVSNALEHLQKGDETRAAAILSEASKHVIAADYRSVVLGFQNGQSKTVYSHMLPCYLTEELDRLQDKEHMQKVIEQDERLVGSTWIGMLSAQQQKTHPMYMRFGHYQGKAYTELSPQERMLYDVEMFFGKPNESYVPIGTPSDSTNSMLVRSGWRKLKTKRAQDRVLENIIKNDKSGLLPGKAKSADDVRTHIAKEAKEYLARGGKALESRLNQMAEKTDTTALALLEDFLLGQFETLWNVSHWIGGAVEEFDNKPNRTVSMQKRMKQILSPGTASALSGEVFKSITFAEPVFMHEKFGAIDRADAQTYVTLDHYAKIMKAHGKLTPAMEQAIEKAKNGEPLTRGQRSLLRPYKPFYYGRIDNNGKRIGVQIKNSLFPLIPADVKGTQLENLLQFMLEKGIAQAQPKSAQKIGRPEFLVKLWTRDNLWDEAGAATFEASVQELPFDHYRQQVQINDHMMHSDTIGWGTQVSKIIMGGLAGTERVQKLLAKEQALVDNQNKELRRKYFDDNGIPNATAIVNLLLNRVSGTSSPAFKEFLVAVKEGRDSITNPHFKGQIANELISILQKEHKHLQVPGGTQVQVSDLGRDNGVDDRLKGMRIDKKTGKVLPAEVITSRNFLPKKYQNMSIEEIRKVDPDALKLIVYRIPCEGKNSMAYVEVKDFLEDGQDGMIVPAEFVAQMGSDFDVDKLYINWKTTKTGKNAEIWNEYFDLKVEILTDPQVFTSEIEVKQGFEKFQELAKKSKASGQTRAMKTMEGTIDSYIAENPYSALSQLQLWQDNMAGISLKGISAKANTFWLNVERFGLTTEFETQIGPIKGLNPNLIDLEHRQNTAQAVAASMDGAKDPVYGYLGINESNFEFFHDLYMLGMDLEEAIKVASNPAVAAEIAKDEYKQKLTEEDKKALQIFEAYDTEWKNVLQPLKQLARVAETKLIKMASDIMPVSENGVMAPMLDGVTHNQGEGIAIQDLPVFKGHLAITKTVQSIMDALQIHYFSVPNAMGLEYSEFLRAQTYLAAEYYLKSNKTLFKRMGKIPFVIENGQMVTRPQPVPGDYKNWNMQDFFSFFTTKEGQEILENDSDLAHVLSHLMIGADYKAKDKQYKTFRFINLRITGLTDAEVAQDFTTAWDSLYDSTKHPIAAAFSDALVEYEAERSGWRYGNDTLSKHMPHRVIQSITSIDSDSLGNVARVVAALNPNITEAKSRKGALKSTKPVRYKQHVYISQYDPVTQTLDRGFITVPVKESTGFKGLEDLNALKLELAINIEAIKEERRKKFSGTQQQKVSTGVEENFDTRRDHLEGIFASSGIHVRVKRDASIDGAGDVEFDGVTNTIRVNPNRMGSDTLIHEFAHIYVELLGYNHPLVQQAISELVNTPLYAEIKALYPELTKRDLEMEVLVTAMGRKGDAIFESVKQQSKFRTIVNRIIRAIGKVLGVQQDTAQLLAENMIQGVNIKPHDVQAFKAEQRISKKIDETQLQAEVIRELGERTREMRELGMTSQEEIQLANEFIEGTRAIAGVNAESDRAGVLNAVTESADTTLQRASAFLTEGRKYINSSLSSPEFGQKDAEFFNQVRQLKQILSTYDQAVNNFIETIPGEEVKKFKALKDRIPQVLKDIQQLERDAISTKLKAQSSNMEIREIEENLFDLASNVELSQYMQDSGVATMGAQGLGEQAPVVLQLLKKQIDKVVEAATMDAQNAKGELDEVLDEYGDRPIEALLDETGQAFVSPIKDEYWKQRNRVLQYGEDIRLWEAQNNHMPYTSEYYDWLYSGETDEIRELRRKLNVLEEIEKKRGLNADEILQRVSWQRDLEDLQIANNNWNKFNEHDVDLEGYRAARAAAKANGTLETFDDEHPFVIRDGVPYPAINNPYHKGFKVRDEYKNPNWKEGDVQRPLDKWRNDKYDALDDVEKKTIERLQEIMGRFLPKDSNFMQQNLIPQINEVPGKSLKEVIKDKLKVEGKEQKQRLDADGRFVPIRKQLPILRRRKKDEPVSTNLRETISAFIDEVSAEQAKNTLTALMLATRDQLAESDLATGKGIDITGIGRQTQRGPAMTRGEQSRAIRVLEHALEGYLGQGWTDQGKYDKIVKKFLSYTSFMGIGLNPSAWINNITYGSLQQRLETMGGAVWTKDQMRRARKDVLTGLVDLVRARKKNVVPSSRVAAIISFFDVTMDQRELPDGVDTLGKLLDKAYIGQTMGEVIMQSQVMIAMLINTKVILADGTETNLYDALEWKGGKAVIIPKGAKIIQVDGLQKELTNQDLGALKSKARGTLQRIHGAYNSEDIGMWHRKTLGQVVYQFRKWVPQAIKRRFGEDSYNEIRETQEVGYYKALWTGVLKGAFKDDRFGAFMAAYNELSDKPHMQVAAKKAMMELGAAMALFALSTLLAALVEIDPDDDDEFMLFNDEFYKAKLLYHTDRLFMEFAQYTPAGIMDFATKIGKDPAAGWRTMMTIGKVITEASYTGLTFGELRTFEGGRNYGDVKLYTYLKRLLPLWKQIDRMQNTVDSYQAYKLVSYS